MMNKTIYVTQSSMPTLEEYTEEIKPIFESKMLTNMGPIYKKFQHQLIDFLNVDYLSLYTNGHLALEYAIEALGLKESGGEVITTPFTFVSTVHAISRMGLKPVFCDINEEDYTIDVHKIESLITDKTVAIMPVHVYGNICDVKIIQEIADRHNLKIIYDAAHAFGEYYKGQSIATFGDASVFSFHATKVFNTVEGGAVAFKNEDYREPFHQLKNFGIASQESIPRIGGNAKLDEFRAAMGICNLRHFNEYIKSRKEIAELYQKELFNIPGIKVWEKQKETESCYSYFPILINEDEYGATRDEVFEYLADNGVHARKYFYPAINEIECYKDNSEPTPIAKEVSHRILTLPLYEQLSQDEVLYICNLLKNLHREVG